MKQMTLGRQLIKRSAVASALYSCAVAGSRELATTAPLTVARTGAVGGFQRFEQRSEMFILCIAFWPDFLSFGGSDKFN